MNKKNRLILGISVAAPEENARYPSTTNQYDIGKAVSIRDTLIGNIIIVNGSITLNLASK